jgi:hypothetical protein
MHQGPEDSDIENPWSNVDDEREDDDGNVHEEAPNNPDILI